MGQQWNRGCSHRSTREPAPPPSADPPPLPKSLVHGEKKKKKKSGWYMSLLGRRSWAGRSPVPALSCPEPSPSCWDGGEGCKGSPPEKGKQWSASADSLLPALPSRETCRWSGLQKCRVLPRPSQTKVVLGSHVLLPLKPKRSPSLRAAAHCAEPGSSCGRLSFMSHSV